MELIKNILVKQQREIQVLLKEAYISRTSNIPFSKNALTSNIIKVILGPRRAGKSVYALHLLIEYFDLESFAYLNLDDEFLNRVKSFDLILAILQEISPNFKILLIDEVQNFPNWELVVNRLQREGYNLLLTGSNAQLLNQELATHLTGRFFQIAIFSFSFKEYCSIDPKLKITPEYQSKLLSYIENGGYPEPLMKNLNYKEYLNTLLNAILYKDIVKRFRIRYPEILDRIVNYFYSNIAAEFSSTNLSKLLHCSDHTIEKYLNYLQEAFLVFVIPRYSLKTRIQARSNRKIYCYDTGFYSTRAFAMSPQLGRMYENLVARTLKQAEIMGVGKVFFWKNENQEEIDFLWMKNQRIIQVIQVCVDLSNLKAQEREYRALLKGAEFLKCDNLLIITESKDLIETISWGSLSHSVTFLPLWKWLLQWEDSLSAL